MDNIDKLKCCILGVGTALFIGAVSMCGQIAEKNDIATIEQGVMEICGDQNHVDKVIDYHGRAKTWDREPESAEELVKRHARVCPGYGKDY